MVEVVLRFFPVDDPYQSYKQFIKPTLIRSQFLPHMKLEFENEDSLLGFSSYMKKTNFTTNSMGFRGVEIDPKDTNSFRIFCIGGSTTECMRLNDGDDWPGLVQKSLPLFENKKVEVQNCGKSGDDLQDHLSMLIYRVAYLKPDVVIIFSGINDVRRSYFDDNPYNIELNRISRIPFIKMWASEFQLYRRFYNVIKNQSAPSAESISIKSNYKEQVIYEKKAPRSDSVPPVDNAIYRSKLKSIIGICKANNIRLIIATQKTNWTTNDVMLKKWLYMNLIYDVAYNKVILQMKMDELNNIQKSVCRDFKVEVLDVDSLIPGSAKYFYDDCHFNPEGSIKMSELVLSKINNKTNIK